MNNNIKTWLVIVVLVFSLVYCFLIPKEKYISEKIITKLNIPQTIANWYSKDVSKNINSQDMRYNFISDVFAHVYDNSSKEALLLLILDAGNFHNPKVCFGSSGYKIKELPDIKINYSSQKSINAHTIFVDKGSESYVIVYWICINKEITDWNEQKLKELWYTLINKKKTGLMVRFDIPSREDTIENSLKIVQKFSEALNQSLSKEDSEYIFGK